MSYHPSNDPNIDPAERREMHRGPTLTGCTYCGDPNQPGRAFCTDRCEDDFRRMAQTRACAVCGRAATGEWGQTCGREKCHEEYGAGLDDAASY